MIRLKHSVRFSIYVVALTSAFISASLLLRISSPSAAASTHRLTNLPEQSSHPQPLFSWGSANSLATNRSAQTRVSEAYGKLPLSFEANTGQTDSRVKFLSRGRGYTLFLTSTEAILNLSKGGESVKQSVLAAPFIENHKPEQASLQLRFVGANPSPKITGLEQLQGKSHYLIGNNPHQWRTGVCNFSSVKYEAVYPGVDVVYYGNQRQLEYDFLLAPGADLKNIKLRFSGAHRLNLDSDGNLLLGVGSEQIRQPRPVVYQEMKGGRKFIAASYRINSNHEVAFEVGAYDHSKPLVIDPVLGYATYLGGSGSDAGLDIFVYGIGYAYVTGRTDSVNFPFAASAAHHREGDSDVFVLKFNETGSAVDFCTYLGGSGYDVGTSIDVNADIYITGLTRSADFPTQKAQQTIYGGGSDAFVTRLSPGGDEILFSTYLGGSGFEIGNGIATNFGAVFVTGATNSADFLSKNALPLVGNVGQDAFVTKFDFSGSTLLYSTKLGGDGEDVGNGIALDLAGNAYIAGDTGSTNLPTVSPLQVAFAGVVDAFVAKLSTTVSEQVSIAYCTYLGGGGSDVASDIAVDASGNAYLAGATNSLNFPLVNPTQNKFGGATDGLVAKLSTTGSTLVFSTYLGGSGLDYAHGIALDIGRNIYVAGETSSADFPLMKPVQANLRGARDGFVTKLNLSGPAMRYSSYLGGDGEEQANAVAATAAGDAWVTGESLSVNFPASTTSVQPLFGGASDAFVVNVQVPVPKITKVIIKGKKLIIEGEFFEQGAVITIGSVPQKTLNDEATPTTRLVAKKGGKSIKPGQTVGLQVENLDGTRSEQISYTRPLD